MQREQDCKHSQNKGWFEKCNKSSYPGGTRNKIRSRKLLPRNNLSQQIVPATDVQRNDAQHEDRPTYNRFNESTIVTMLFYVFGTYREYAGYFLQ